MRSVLLLFLLNFLVAYASADIPESDRSRKAINRVEAALSADLSHKSLKLGAPIFIQITKQPAELRVFVEDDSGRFRPFRTYPICAYSGGLGPKKRQGDGKSPEGIYSIRPRQMNPASSYHLSFNLGYPNAFDRSKGYTGDFLMVHGRCVSIGCYAMTDPAMDEIWTLMVNAFSHGQRDIQVHIFPYKMNWPVRSLPRPHPDFDFWSGLAPAWTQFARTEIPPKISVAAGQYVIEAAGR